MNFTSYICCLYRKIKENKYEFPESIVLSTEAKTLISSLLSQKPECRPQVQDIYNHPFMTCNSSRKSSKTNTPSSRRPLLELTNNDQSSGGGGGGKHNVKLDSQWNSNYPLISFLDAVHRRVISLKGSEATTPKKQPPPDETPRTQKPQKGLSSISV